MPGQVEKVSFEPPMNGIRHTQPSAEFGGFEGAARFDRSMALWRPSLGSPDQMIRIGKDTHDARSRSSTRDNGYLAGVQQVHQDSIVGAQYRLNARPNWRVLQRFNKGYNEAWADAFQQQVEAIFTAFVESPDCWIDASRNLTFTGMIRLAVACFVPTGNTFGTAEWVKESLRPYQTCIQFVRNERVCNPMGVMDTRTLRSGIEIDMRGKPVAYNFRMGERFDPYPDSYAWTWKTVKARKPWGRKQVLHVYDPRDMGQTRGVSDMVAVLRDIYMTKKFSDVTLQQAVINATYAAAIESELPQDAVAVAMGANAAVPGAGGPSDGMLDLYGAYMGALGQYLGGADNIAMDGVKIPHMFPGTKLNIRNTGTPGGIGTNFETSMLRKVAAGLGVSYESLSRDFSKTNYSSGRLAQGLQKQAMAARKKMTADRFATDIYALVLEEMMAAGDVPLPKGATREDFYLPLAKEAFTACDWISSGAGQIDELKETQAAILRIRSGLSTHETESAALGGDWREITAQRVREQKAFADAGLPQDYISQKPMDKPTDTLQDDPSNNSVNEEDGETDESGNPDDPQPSKGQSS